MADDDVQRFAYDNAVFHDIIQHYDNTARGNHDDIEYDPAGIDNLDGAEYDHNGEPVILIGFNGPIDHNIFIVLNGVVDAIEQFGSFDDIPEEHDFLPSSFYTTISHDYLPDDCGHRPADHRIWRCGRDDDFGGLNS